MGETTVDIYERCAKFSADTLHILRTLQPSYIDRPLIVQLVRSATSIGANMMEANESVSKKDFINRLGISLKEAKESQYWLKLLVTTHPTIKPLADEADEIIKILATIKRKYLSLPVA